MAPEADKTEVASSLSKLSLGTEKPSTTSTKAKPKDEIADSWEDEDLSDGADDAPEEKPSKPSTPAAPPPTPASPSYSANAGWPTTPDSMPTSPRAADPSRRPEKTDAVARRMIAAGLGLKAPKQTEEQKAYQRSVREQEKKRRDEERAEEQRRREQTEKAKAAVWDD